MALLKKTELKLCGLPAVKARWQKDPTSIQRLFFDQKTGRSVGTICSALAASRKVYRCVDTAELERISGSTHHGGIVAIVTQERSAAPKPQELRAWASAAEPLVVLDRIGNSHNLGAIARSAAYFGIRHIVIPVSEEASRANDAAYRVSEGGLEALRVWQVEDLPGFLAELASLGYEVLGAATRGGRALRPGQGLREFNGKPVALVMGNEEHGMSREVQSACTRLVTLQGTGEVESLNVSVAAALLIWELLAHAPQRRSQGSKTVNH